MSTYDTTAPTKLAWKRRRRSRTSTEANTICVRADKTSPMEVLGGVCMLHPCARGMRRLLPADSIRRGGKLYAKHVLRSHTRVPFTHTVQDTSTNIYIVYKNTANGIDDNFTTQPETQDSLPPPVSYSRPHATLLRRTESGSLDNGVFAQQIHCCAEYLVTLFSSCGAFRPYLLYTGETRRYKKHYSTGKTHKTL